MCGRFLLRCPPESWPADLFGNTPEIDDPNRIAAFQPRLNIAPTQRIFAVVQDSGNEFRSLKMLRWGLIPAWATDRKIGANMINARSETIDQKPSFRVAFTRRRCLIPADGYYEWTQTAAGKQPMLIQRPNRELFCFAGLWERNEKLPADKDGIADPANPLLTCTIITTAANQSLAPIHDRMPVVIDPEQYATWLDPHHQNAIELRQCLVAAGNDYFIATPVARVSGD